LVARFQKKLAKNTSTHWGKEKKTNLPENAHTTS
jgi:hypothetical protein